jgi:hypothetical protein
VASSAWLVRPTLGYAKATLSGVCPASPGRVARLRGIAGLSGALHAWLGQFELLWPIASLSGVSYGHLDHLKLRCTDWNGSGASQADPLLIAISEFWQLN